MNEENVFSIAGSVLQGLSLLSYFGFGIRLRKEETQKIEFHHFISNNLKALILIILCFSNFFGIVRWGFGIEQAFSIVILGIQRWILLASLVSIFLEFNSTSCTLCKHVKNPNFIQKVRKHFSLPKYSIHEVKASRGTAKRVAYIVVYVGITIDLILSVLQGLIDAGILPDLNFLDYYLFYFQIAWISVLIIGTCIHYLIEGSLIHLSKQNVDGLWVAKLTTSFLILFNICWIGAFTIWYKFGNVSPFQNNLVSLIQETLFVIIQTLFSWLLSKR